MQKDDLLEIKNSIEKYCKENNIVIFYGDIDASRMPQVEWDSDDSGNWQGYLNALKQLNVRILSIEVYLNSLEEDESISSYYGTLEGEDKRIFKKALDTIKKVKGHIATLSLSYFYEGVRYAFEMEAEWANQHMQLLEAYDERRSVNDNDNNDENRIGEQRANSIAQMLLEEESFIKANHRNRSQVAQEILMERKEELKLTEMDVYNVAWRANRLFAKEVQPKLDKEVEKKVKELKLKGLSKTAVKGQLGITESTIGKYWYL